MNRFPRPLFAALASIALLAAVPALATEPPHQDSASPPKFVEVPEPESQTASVDMLDTSIKLVTPCSEICRNATNYACCYSTCVCNTDPDPAVRRDHCGDVPKDCRSPSA